MVGEMGFGSPSQYIPKDVIVPTLDDVPDTVNTSMAKMPGNWTKSDLRDLLDVMTTLGKFRMDFFINTKNACDITGNSNPDCAATVVDILTLHNPGNHTVHHSHLAGPDPGNGDPFCSDASCVDAELSGVETVISALSNGGRPHLTRFRAPFGEPYQVGTMTYVQPEVAKFAVMVGWNFDSTDSEYDTGTVSKPNVADCAQYNTSTPGPCPTGAAIAQVVESALTGGNWGIVLMHGVFGWTHDALKILFDPVTGWAVQHNYRIGTVEDVICWKYGMHSWDVVNTLNHYTGTPQERQPN
jgi:hypothetical protein